MKRKIGCITVISFITSISLFAQDQALSKILLREIQSFKAKEFSFVLEKESLNQDEVNAQLESFKNYQKLKPYFSKVNFLHPLKEDLEFSEELKTYIELLNSNPIKVNVLVSPAFSMSMNRVCYLGRFKYQKGGSEFVYIFEKSRDGIWHYLKGDYYLDY